MRRLVALVMWEARIQYRQGIYFAAAFVVVLMAAAYAQLPRPAVELLLPVTVFMDLSVIGVYFMAALLFLERQEGSLQALVITPLRPGQYLAVKALSLTLLAVLATAGVAVTGYGLHAHWLPLLVGAGLNSWLMTLFGFWLAARYTSISEFVAPSILWFAPTQLPLLAHFGIWTGWPLYLIPTQGTMLLMEAGFGSIARWQWAYAIGYLALASVVTWRMARRAFDRFVVLEEPAR